MTHIYYLTYNDKGRILQITHNEEEHKPVGALALIDIPDNQIEFIKNNYILNGVITPRLIQDITRDKSTIIADGIDVLTISGITPNSFITIEDINTVPSIKEIIPNNNISGIVQGTTETFSTTIAGKYKITITNWPYFDYILNIEAI